MERTKAPHQGKKRGNDGKEKPPADPAAPTQRDQEQQPQADAPTTEQTIPEAQSQAPTRDTSALETKASAPASRKKQKHTTPNPPPPPPHREPQPNPQPRTKKQKHARLPDNTSITKRPLHHPLIPTPFASASASAPKTLYITASSPFIPAIKRIRRLLAETAKRAQQSRAAAANNARWKPQPQAELQPNGRLAPQDVERQIAEGSRENNGGSAAAVGKGQGKGAEEEEEVYVKATGRAIPRALEIGVFFQKESDCKVRVEIGSVSAIDDIAVKRERAEEAGAADGDAMDVDGDDEAKPRKRNGKKKWKEEDIPETRVRTLSSVTVAVRLK
ncbi:Rpp20 subunit of nuclear RNase MRP and P-domain-containing protein [Massariosphaeria phaeospora]|uniref:Rpp20 subunit of nuclear RNase MRP and P-domain-containing protein n=1 Tax=Massariosphaeria phaeospora TaxID=100035 RepID=A0A7C8I0D2_9PLEO|nr:Rpp20 subunit of nuclear RNase MRP and P-domain-containing protein [Massariosphaeria phaeospora]